MQVELSIDNHKLISTLEIWHGNPMSRYLARSINTKGEKSLKYAINHPLALSLFSVEEAAKILGISRSYLYQLVREEKIPSVRIGKLLKIRRTDLECWVERLEINSYDHPWLNP